MCKYKSGIILKNKVVLAPTYNDSHSNLLEKLKIEDNYENAVRTFVRVELIPPKNDRATDVSEWKYNVDQDRVPDWYENDPGRYEDEFRKEVAEYVKKTTSVILGKSWTVITMKDGNVMHLLNGSLKTAKFGNSNNYAVSDVREDLNNCQLNKDLRELYGDKLVPIKLDLTSLDGLTDYGSVEGDILSLMNIDLYREYRNKIPNIDEAFWLSTPDSTPSGYGSECVRCVSSGGSVGCGWCDNDGAVRPFFILKS